MFELRMIGAVAGLLADFVRFTVEECWWVGFAKEEKTADLYRSISDRSGVEGPSPSRVFCDETASDWTNCRAQKRRKTVDADCSATLICSPAIA